MPVKISVLSTEFKQDPECYNVLFRRSRTQFKVTWHTKNHENFNLYSKRLSTDANDNMIQMLELPNRDFEADTLRANMNTLEIILK